MTVATATTKVCSGPCGTEKKLDDFSVHKTGRMGRHPQCKDCRRQASQGYYQRWSEDQREAHRVAKTCSRYGIDIATYEALIEQPCGICEREGSARGRVCIDHDHRTGRVRGVLCTECNLAIGYLRDDPTLLRNALAYLEGGQ